MENTLFLTNSASDIAVAIYYEKKNTPLPVVVTKGAGTMARTILDVARNENVPVYQDAELAQRLFKQSKLNDYVPDEMLKEIAAVLRWVYQKRKPLV